MYNLIDVVHCYDQALEDVCTLLCFLQIELGTTDGYVVTMVNEVADAVLQVEEFRTQLQLIGRVRYQCDVINRE